MRWFRSGVVGILAAVVVSAIAILGDACLTGYLIQRRVIAEVDLSQGGIGAEAVDVNVLPVVCLAFVAFGLAFFWTWRRDSRVVRSPGR